MSSKLISSRRDLMKAFGSLAGAAAVGCGKEEPGQQEDQAIECFFNSRQEDAQKNGGTFGDIEHIVVLMMENRSFDHYFGALSIPEGMTDSKGADLGGEGRSDVLGLTGAEFNLDLQGNQVGLHRLKETRLGDLAHEWEDCKRQLDYESTGNPMMDGFVRRHEEDVLRQGEASFCATYEYFGTNLGCPPIEYPMGIYAREDLPVMYALADNYTLCDNWFSSVLGPTWPNRFYMHACSSNGEVANKPVLGMRTIWEKMREQCLPVLNYYCDLPWAQVVGEGFLLGTSLGDGVIGGILEQFHASQPGIGSFYQDVQNGNLPMFSVIDPGFSSGYDDHPPADVALGQAFISYVYRILRSNPEVWAKTLFVITYDEHGSFYDHMAPPGPEARDLEGNPLFNTFDEQAHMRQLGMRVPTLVMGPSVKKGYVSHSIYDHCSVAATAYDRYNIASNNVGYLNDRQKYSTTLADCIDPNFDPANPVDDADIPVMEFSESELMDWANRDVYFEGQPGLSKMADSGQIPSEKDLRRYRKQNLMEFLEQGEQVGAFKITN